jgi:copper chaperone
MKTVVLKVDGMHCDGCAERLSKLLDREHGVRDVKVSFALSSAEIGFNEAVTSQSQLHKVVTMAGFSVEKD